MCKECGRFKNAFEQYYSEGFGSITCVSVALTTPLPVCPSTGKLDQRAVCHFRRGGALYVREKKAKCGDGVRARTETCDDGNAADSDGCSSSCSVEAGYMCRGALHALSTCVLSV